MFVSLNFGFLGMRSSIHA